MNELSSDLKIRHDFKIHNLCIKLKVNLEWLAAKREKDLWERERERERESDLIFEKFLWKVSLSLAEL